MDKLDILWNIEQIKQLKARYFRYLDTREQESFYGLFAEDLELLWTDESGNIVHHSKSRDELRQWFTTRAAARNRGQAVHHGLTCEITIIDEENASGIWAMTDYTDYPDMKFRGYGHYHEKYVKKDGEWKIKRIELTRLRTDRSAHVLGIDHEAEAN